MESNKGNLPNKCTVLAVSSTKGGSSKSLLIIAISSYLSSINKKILIFDGDIQPSVTDASEIDEDNSSEYGMYEFISGKTMAGKVIKPAECISKTTDPNIDIVISNDAEGHIRSWISDDALHIFELSTNIKEIKSEYDYILIDSPGTNDSLSQSVALAGDFILCPTVPEMISISQYQNNTLDMFEALTRYEKMGLPHNIGEIKVVISRKANTKEAREIASGIREITPDNDILQLTYLKTEIPQYAAFSRAIYDEKPSHLTDKRVKKILGELIIELFPELEKEIKIYMGEI